MMKSEFAVVEPYKTKDGSLIRELLHPTIHGPGKMSLAHAEVEPGMVTKEHCHRLSEEVYHVLTGYGQLSVGDEIAKVKAGDTVMIPPGTYHSIKNTSGEPLQILCCCTPPYNHKDTFLKGGI